MFPRLYSRKRPVSEAGTINPSNRSMNSLRSNSISHFVAQIAHRNQRLNIDSKDLHSSKDLLVRNNFENTFEKHEAPCGNRLSASSPVISTKRWSSERKAKLA